ncbi:unnamed protein product [Nippostrongylus brasiliensis]|uniref:Methyltranfer_dom domain-containing protein n=1 Tax=Nippostrongylus brasiliensis TaxID=27835 RepID=A0A0N4XV52_NIPBR|nr:unnamed protein product [Nippostrongylus brasiliensis]
MAMCSKTTANLLLIGALLCYFFILISINNRMAEESRREREPPPSPNRDYASERIEHSRKDRPAETPKAKPTRRAVEYYKLQVPERRAHLSIVRRSYSKNYMFLYNNLAPEAFCPELLRVGTTNDGGKWICSPYSFPTNCNIISLGMNNQITFEEELQHMTGNRCRLFAYDMAGKVELSDITDQEKNQYTIEDLMKMEEISKLEILKVDLLIEIHGTPYETTTLLRDIATLGYWLYSYEINGAWPNLCEFSFIHENAFKRYHVTPLAQYLS